MLQRAASNAYSWWWASHIRTTQSKWLDANLQDMENRVKIMLKLLGEEADSFGKRAEMYYQKRPEVISHVEQVYRAYRALVERYDHISKELHRANHTIATACPEEVQYAMLEEEDDNFPKAIMPINSNKIHKSTVEEIIKRRREGLSRRNRGLQLGSAPHMNKEKAEEEITRLQKAILILQTEKEFVKSSYDNGIARYWEIEKQIADMQEEICHIQDDFDAHAPIDDDEARALMMITALKSCQGTVAKLVDKFEELTRITVIEEVKTKSLRAQLYAMSGNTDMSSGEAGRQDMPVNRRVYPITQEILELQPIYEKIENFFANTSESSAEEMAERVDELIDKVMCLELKFPKQSAQIKQLKQENENFKNKLYELQDEMALRDDPSDSNEQLKLLENELNRVRVLERSIIEDEVFVSTAFSEVFNCITGISKTLVSSGPINGNSEMVSNGVGLENITKESSLMKGEECRDIEEPSKSKSLGQGREDVSKVVDNSSSRHTGGTHDSKNGYEENPRKNCLEDLREEYSPDKTSLPEVDCTCFSGADASPDYHHTDEAKSIKKLSENGVQFNATQNIKSLNKYSKIKSSEEDSHISLGHVDNTQDMKSSILVDTYSSETRDGTSLCTPVRGSKETGGLHQQVSLVHTDSEYMANDIFHNRLEKKSSNSEEPTSRTSTLSNHGGRSQCENSTLTGGEGVTSWQNFLLDGLEGREAILLADYTSVLHNYKETKRRLAELEKKNQEHLEETKVVIRELRNANSMKYVEIRSLRNLLDSTEMPSSEADSNPTGFSSRRSFRESDISNGTLDREILTVEVTNVSHIEAPKSTSPFEVKFRNEIDALVDENLQIVVRYSMACHHMQDFHRKYQEVLNEMDNMEDKKTGESNITTESEPAEKKLRELRTELDVWFEQNALLHQEVQLKTTSLCNLQEEIAEALRASSEIDGLKFTHNLQEEIAEALRASSEIDGLKFTPFEAAKFQGEVLNMQQSNIKIESELQASQESMRELQTKVNDALRNMCESFELSSRRLSQPETESSYQNQFKHFPSKSRVPLRNFLFGTKRKKKSMFACINPTLQKQFSDL